MASEKVQIELSVEDAKAAQAWLRQVGSLVKYADELKKLEDQSAKASKTSAAGFNLMEASAKLADSGVTKLSTSLALMATVWKGVHKLAELYKQELDQVIQRQKQAADQQVSFAPAFRRAFHAAGGEVPADELYETLVKGANGVNPGELAQTFEAASSAAGKLGKRQVLASVMQTAQMRPDLDVESRSNLTTGALQVQKEFGGTTEQAMAAVQQAFTTSRVESLSQFSKNAVPTAVALHQMGRGKDSFEDIMSMVVGFGQGMNDPTGERSRTGLIHLAKELKEKGAAAGVVGGEAGIMETLKAVRGNAPLQKKLLGAFAQNGLGESATSLHRKIKEGKLTTEAAAFQASVDLVTGRADSSVMQEMATARGGLLPIGDEGVAAVNARADELRRSRHGAAFELRQIGAQAGNEQDLLSSFGTLGQAQNFVSDAFTRMGVNPLGRGAISHAMEAASTRMPETEESYLRIGRYMLRKYATPIAEGRDPGLGIGDLGSTSADREAARGYLKIADKLDELIQLQKQPIRLPADVQPKASGAAELADRR